MWAGLAVCIISLLIASFVNQVGQCSIIPTYMLNIVIDWTFDPHARYIAWIWRRTNLLADDFYVVAMVHSKKGSCWWTRFFRDRIWR